MPRPRSRRAGVAATAVVVVAGLVGWYVMDSAPRAVTTSDAVLLVSGRAGGAMEALGLGRLDLGPTGCVGLVGDDGSFGLVVFPHGTSIESEDPLVVRLDDLSVALGDRVELGGGWTSTDGSDDLVPSEARTRCGADEVFLAG